MKLLKTAVLSTILCTACLYAGDEGAIDYSSVSEALEALKERPSAEYVKRKGWSVVSLVEDGSRVVWFFAPKEHGIYPALIKKTITEKKGSTADTVMLSLCEAPKQKCDDLARQFKDINESYK